MRHPGYEYSATEKRVGFLILLCLALIAGGVFLRQFSFNPAVLLPRNVAPGKSAGAKASERPAWVPSDLAEFGAPESFTPDNLYDKIDGKAELYLAAGFVRLNCQRFALKEAPGQWLEWFVYDMGTVPQAFAVFTTQRRPDGQPLDLTEYAYKTRNALYFVSGSNYVEAVASTTGEPLMNALLAMARGFVAANTSGPAHLAQLELFPTENLEPGSYALQTADVFGFDRFKNVFTAHYKAGQAGLLAFVMPCPDATAASALRDAYRAFLIENGGKPAEAQAEASADQPIRIMDSIEIVFSVGHYVAGVHAAPDLPSATRLAGALRGRLTQKSP